VLAVAAAGSLCLGRYPTAGFSAPWALWGDAVARRVVVDIRLPRVLGALMLGSALAGAGAVLQMLFRNPLVEPGFLGVSQGAALGAGAGILWFGGSAVAVQGLAAGLAMAGLLASWALARKIRYGGWILRLLLAGIAVGAVFSAGLGLMKAVADPLKQLPDLTFWLMGGLWGVRWETVLRFAPAWAAAMAVAFAMRWRTGLLSLGDETASSLGVAVAAERLLLLLAAAAAVASTVAYAGIVGWVGLLVPHVARRMAGADSRRSLPLAMVLGALFALGCDGVARTAAATEIPLGILTSLAGTALFLWWMCRKSAAGGAS
jgi:iron complex transport system permease protein